MKWSVDLGRTTVASNHGKGTLWNSAVMAAGEGRQVFSSSDPTGAMGVLDSATYACLRRRVLRSSEV